MSDRLAHGPFPRDRLRWSSALYTRCRRSGPSQSAPVSGLLRQTLRAICVVVAMVGVWPWLRLNATVHNKDGSLPFSGLGLALSVRMQDSGGWWTHCCSWGNVIIWSIHNDRGVEYACVLSMDRLCTVVKVGYAKKQEITKIGGITFFHEIGRHMQHASLT